MSLAYKQWTDALYQYFTRNIPVGGEVFLSVDQAILDEIGEQVLKPHYPNVTDWQAHFLSQVQAFVINKNKKYTQRLEYNWLKSTENKVICPMAVGYLAAQVLAAHRMKRDEEVTEAAYIIRLRDVMGLNPNNTGRPSELKAETDEKLWALWNAWIESEGWLSTAHRGQGNYRYINYPISQALLRDGDKERLRSEFQNHIRAGSLRRNWDQDHLAHWLIRSKRASSKVKSMLEQPGTSRYNALIESVYEIYISLEKNQTDIIELDSNIQRNLTAGLFRYEHLIKETIRYYPYPRQARRTNLMKELMIEHQGQVHILKQERTGWFERIPIPILNPAQGIEWKIKELTGFNKLILPGAEFWVLVRDPDYPDSHHWGTWHRPAPGEHFMLLCQAKYRSEMERLQGLKLIDWSDVFEVDDLQGDWLEFENCLVTNLDWEGVFASNTDLLDALMPHLQISISLTGGLKLPEQEGWLATHPPLVQVSGVNTQIEILLFQFLLVDEKIEKKQVFETKLETNQSLNLPPLQPGRYLIEANHPHLDYRARRNLLLSSWDELKPAPIKQHYKTTLPNGESIQGVWIGAQA